MKTITIIFSLILPLSLLAIDVTPWNADIVCQFGDGTTIIHSPKVILLKHADSSKCKSLKSREAKCYRIILGDVEKEEEISISERFFELSPRKTKTAYMHFSPAGEKSDTNDFTLYKDSAGNISGKWTADEGESLVINCEER